MSEKKEAKKDASEDLEAANQVATDKRSNLIKAPPRSDIVRTKKIMALDMLARGYSTREVAAKVDISTATVHAWKVAARDGTMDQDIIAAAEASAGARVARLALVADQAVEQISDTIHEANTRDAATALRELHTIYRLESGQSTANVAIEGVLTHAMQGLGLDDAVTQPTGRDTNERLGRLKQARTVDAEVLE